MKKIIIASLFGLAICISIFAQSIEEEEWHDKYKTWEATNGYQWTSGTYIYNADRTGITYLEIGGTNMTARIPEIEAVTTNQVLDYMNNITNYTRGKMPGDRD